MSSKELEITNKLAENEETIAQLYSLFADKFPEFQLFWSELVKEETKHAAWIKRLYTEAEKGRLVIKPYRFNLTAVQNQVKHIEDEIARAKIKGYSIINALSAALNLETSLLEFKYFEVFDSFSPEMKHRFSEIAEETKNHLTKVRDAWQKHTMN